jgi:RNA polymerase sigma factor (sigma-70 family)
LAAVPELGRANGVEQRVAPEAAATQDLYERYAAQIFSFCLHRLGSREEAEDAVQQTFLNAFRGLRRGIDVETESAWLFKIAHNVCLTRRRSAWRRGKVETPNDMEGLQEFVAAPQRMGTDDLIQLQDALAAMPTTQRKAILLREWQGLSYHEIAEQMEISQAAVETLIFRARRTLAQGLERPPTERRAWRRLRQTMDVGGLVSGLLGGAVAKVAATTAAVTAMAVVPAGIEQNRVPATPPASVAPQLAVVDEEPVAAPVPVAPVRAEATSLVPAAAPASKPKPAPRQGPAPAPPAEAPVEPDPGPVPVVEPSAPAPQPAAEEPKAEEPPPAPAQAPAPASAEPSADGNGKGKAKGKEKHGDRAPQAASVPPPVEAPVVAAEVVEQPPPAQEPEPEHGGGKPEDKPDKAEKDKKK